MVYGHSVATQGKITTAGGVVQQGNFDDYPVSRMNDAPLDVRVHVLDDYVNLPPCGVGEPGVPPYAPALANALFGRHRQAHPRAADRGSAAGVALSLAPVFSCHDAPVRTNPVDGRSVRSRPDLFTPAAFSNASNSARSSRSSGAQHRLAHLARERQAVAGEARPRPR